MKYILTGILIFLIIACSVKSNNRIDNKNFNYINYKKEFKENLIAFFPDSLNEQDSYMKNIDYSINSIQFMVTCRDIEGIDNLSNKYEKQAKQVYAADDTCLLVVNGYINETNYYKADDVRDKDVAISCDESFLPVPNFFNLKFEKSVAKTKLPQGFYIYVLDSEPGNFWDNDMLKPSRSMPKKWENGYSKGVAISKKRKEIIYWIIIW